MFTHSRTVCRGLVQNQRLQGRVVWQRGMAKEACSCQGRQEIEGVRELGGGTFPGHHLRDPPPSTTHHLPTSHLAISS